MEHIPSFLAQDYSFDIQDSKKTDSGDFLRAMNFDQTEKTRVPPIATEKVVFERKVFFLDLQENQRGRFFKISENVGGRRNTILLPADAFGEFTDALCRLVEFEGKL